MLRCMCSTGARLHLLTDSHNDPGVQILPSLVQCRAQNREALLYADGLQDALLQADGLQNAPTFLESAPLDVLVWPAFCSCH